MTRLNSPQNAELRILFSRSRYDLKNRFDALETGIATQQADDVDALMGALPHADVLLVGGNWKNDWLTQAPRLKYLQSISSGSNQYDTSLFAERGIVVASGRGVNVNAVSEHALGLLLALARQLPRAQGDQQRKHWSRGPAPSDILQREDELAGKTLLIIGLGAIGDRLARLASAFDMHVIGIRNDPAKGKGSAHEVYAFADLKAHLPRADAIALTCPFNAQTKDVINTETLALLRPTAWLINVARGGCIDEAALIKALEEGRLAGAGLDVAVGEPLPPEAPLWQTPNTIITPHRACETRSYEDNLLTILTHNLKQLLEGGDDYLNRIV